MTDSKLPSPTYFEEQAALQLLVPRAKLLAALADALETAVDPVGALALEELMQLGYTVEAGAILPPRDLPENACEFFGVRPVAVAGPAWDKTRDSLSMLMMGFASNSTRSIQAACTVLDSATEPGMPLAYLRGAAPALEAPAAPGDGREAFEAWALAKPDWKPNLERKGDGYSGAFAQSAWDGWRGRGAAPAAGSWIAAEEVARLVRELDVALHGEADAAPQASLCDIVGLAKAAAGKLGRPVLAAPAVDAPWKDHQTARLVNDLRDCAQKYHGAGQLRERIAHIVAPLCDQLKASPVAAPAVEASDTDLLDAMQRHRIALVPEFEGPWDAEIYNDDAEARSIASGNTPREALRAALAAQAKEGGA